MAAAADAVILDLEDAVAPDNKDAARRFAAEALNGRERSRVGVRVNAIETPWYLADLIAIAPAKPAFIMLPKCGGAADIVRLAQQLDLLEAQSGIAMGSIGILPLVTESAAAVLRCEFAGASPRLIGLCFAAEDLSTDLGIAPRSPAGRYPAPLLLARASVLLAATAAGVPAIDTPYPVPADLDGLRRESMDALADGLRQALHPSRPDRDRERGIFAERQRDRLGSQDRGGLRCGPGQRCYLARRQDGRQAASSARAPVAAPRRAASGGRVRGRKRA